jgi:UDP-N-acetylglucosamine 2-epimerase (non-hydrolysing)
MMRHKVLSVVGTRPNLVKMAPVVREIAARGDRFLHVLVHTGQHYDDPMSQVFIDELGVGAPDWFLGVGSGSHAQQVARVMERFAPVIVEEQPDLVLVPGDVNSTLGAALAAAQLAVPLGHVEAGLRSFDRTMPEEINRTVADALADLLFIHSPEARDNLVREGRPDNAIYYVGNTMIDTLVAMRSRIDAIAAPERHGLESRRYAVVTLHRPALVDGPLLADAVSALAELAEHLTVVFPTHPRTLAGLARRGLEAGSGRFRILGPLGYLEFLSLEAHAAAVITDSGGIQEETTFLGVPCFTLRANTDRPVTIEQGTNTLLGLAPDRIREIPRLLDAARGRPARIPPRWDGRAAERIVDVLDETVGALAPALPRRGTAAAVAAGAQPLA